MKKSFLILAALTLSFSAQARDMRFGSECGLVDSSGDEALVDVGRPRSLGRATDAQIHALPTLVKQQLIIAARHLIDEHVAVEFRDSVEAANCLREGSEAGDLSVYDFRVNGRRYTQVMTYPGGNPYGVIFLAETRTVVAFTQDSDIVCK
jgi:hypothetical protein